jgi:large subunit ribosomal protein L23
MGVLIRPLVTEKFSSMNEKGKYGFVVTKTANKVQIKKEVEKKYGVNVVSVNTMIQPGRTKSRYTKSGVIVGKTPAYKKAVVELAKDEIIDFYSEV